jgi:hypothetical protein
VVVICDSAGNIETLISAPQGGARVSMLPLEPGKHELELDIRDLSENVDDLALLTKFREIKESYSVDLTKRSLTKRP